MPGLFNTLNYWGDHYDYYNPLLKLMEADIGFNLNGLVFVYLSHSLFPQRNVVGPECDPGHNCVRIGLEDDATVADLIDGQHDDVQILEERFLFDVFSQNLADRVVHAVQDSHEDELVLL